MQYQSLIRYLADLFRISKSMEGKTSPDPTVPHDQCR